MKMLAVLCVLFVVQPAVWAQYDYAEVLQKSILFFEAERSGALPGNNRVPWRGDSALGDSGNGGEDLTGGWYDAGDHVKFGFPLASSLTQLCWGLVEFEGGYGAAGEVDNMRDSVRWVTDYLMKCHTSQDEFYGQVADGYEDHAFWGRPEDMTMWRPAFSISSGAPGSDLAGETAAALAACSVAFEGYDPGYAGTVLQHARELYDLAYNHRGLYTDHIPASDFYGSGTPWAFSWDDKNAGVQLMMHIMTGEPQYATDVEAFLRSWMPGGSVQYTPQGLAWRDMWGPLRYSGNTCLVAMIAGKHGIMSGEVEDWARGQIHYMLGDTGRSYVVGFGNNPPERPHHRAASCSPDHSVWCDWEDYNRDAPNPSILYGALVGGPDENDYYEDDRGDYIKNEVACDYNAGFQGALAGLLDLKTKAKL